MNKFNYDGGVGFKSAYIENEFIPSFTLVKTEIKEGINNFEINHYGDTSFNYFQGTRVVSPNESVEIGGAFFLYTPLGTCDAFLSGTHLVQGKVNVVIKDGKCTIRGWCGAPERECECGIKVVSKEIAGIEYY